MCARRNQKAHPKLIGRSEKCDFVIRTWQGLHSRHMTSAQSGQAYVLRSSPEFQGRREADVLDEIERRCGTIQPHNKNPVHKVKDLLGEHWSELKWHRNPLILVGASPSGSALETTCDFLARCNSGDALQVVIAVQREPGDLAIVTRLEHLLNQACTVLQGEFEGAIVALHNGVDAIRREAKRTGIALFTCESVRSLSGSEIRTKVRLKPEF